MSDEEREHLNTLLKNYTDRFRMLEVQQSRKGINTEPAVIMEIDDLREQIQSIKAKLASLPATDKAAGDLAPPGMENHKKQALQRYLRRMLKMYNTLPLDQLDPDDTEHTQPMKLAQVYVDLCTTDQVELTDREKRKLRRDPLALAHKNIPQTRLLLAVEALAPAKPRGKSTAVEALAPAKPQRLLLLGAPGSGKSTFVTHLALCLAGAMLDVTEIHPNQPGLKDLRPERILGPLLPILVTLRDFAASEPLKIAPRGSLRTLLDFLQKNLQEAASTEALELFEAALDRGEAILLFDGLDEIAEIPLLERVTESIIDAAYTYARSPILVTCRILDYQTERLCKLPGFTVKTLAALTDKEIDRFVRRWYIELADSGRRSYTQVNSDAEALIEVIEQRSELRELARSPLLLTMLAVVHAGKGTLPDARALLYYECIDLLLLRWRRRGEPGLSAQLGLSQFKDVDVWHLMARLAYEAHVRAEHQEIDSSRPADLRKDEIIGSLAKGFEHYNPSSNFALAQTLFNVVTKGNGLLLEHGPNTYRFPHRTFQEFLAGYYLKNHRNHLQTCLNFASHANRHEALLLMAGHLVQKEDEVEKPLLLAQGLLAKGSVEQVLAGELLSLIGYARLADHDPSCVQPDGIWIEAQHKLRELATRSETSEAPAPLRVRAGLLLGTLCYGSLNALCRPDVFVPLPDPRLPLSVVGLKAQFDPGWTSDFARYWCGIGAESFWHGWHGSQPPGLLQQSRVYSPFKIARYLITNADFARFIADGGYTMRHWWSEQGWNRLNKNITVPFWFKEAYNPLQPVIGVSWYEADAYCGWLTEQGHTLGWLPSTDELRLPTALEWERTARNTDRRIYPWGDEEPNTERANYLETGIGAPTPIGCFPYGTAECGALDMAGNVWEWTATVWEQPDQLTPIKEVESISQTPIICGGAFNREKKDLDCSSRERGELSFIYAGFRIVWASATP